MNTTTRFPEWLPGPKPVSKEIEDMTKTPEGVLKALWMFNNIAVKEQKGHYVLIMATTFVCEGIARILGYKVYKALPKYGPAHYVVDTRRPANLKAA